MLEIKPSIFYCGVQDKDLEVFDIIMRTPYGTSYNAYIIKGQEKTALIETVKINFWDEFEQRVNEITSFSEIDYLIMNHTEPDHAGSIVRLLERNPSITIVGTNSAIQFLTHIVHKPFQSKVVKKGDTLHLGDRELSFYPMPNLHWPDTMYTLDSLSKALFTCDSFGSHYTYPPVLLSKMEDQTHYIDAQKRYYDDILSPFAHPFMDNGIRFVEETKPSVICTGHGPVIDCGIDEVLERCKVWGEKQKRDHKLVIIAYVSSYGYTQKIANRLEETLSHMDGIVVRSHQVDEQNKEQVLADILESDGFLLGTPTILSDALQPILELTSALHPICIKGKAASAFGSYGWSGEGVPNVLTRLEQLKAKTIEGLKIRFQPSDEEMQTIDSFASCFASLL